MRRRSLPCNRYPIGATPAQPTLDRSRGVLQVGPVVRAIVRVRLALMWPAGTVRRWEDVLYRRHPPAAEDDYMDDYDPVEAAAAARSVHERRGLVMAQVAEIEHLLLHILRQAELRGGVGIKEGKGRVTAGQARGFVHQVLEQMGVADRCSGALSAIRVAIDRRNELVHARVGVGFTMWRGFPEPVITLLVPHTNGLPDPIDGYDLDADLENAYVALEAAIDIWELMDDMLPPAPPATV